MRKEVIGNITLYEGDCMEGMKEMPDKAFKLAIVDPPYGIRVGIDGRVGKNKCAPCKQYKPVKWDEKPPDETYFKELKRVSLNQIIWGVNYHPFDLTGGRIVWDKDNSGNFSDCELAYQSFSIGVRKFTYRWNGMFQQNMKNKEIRIHPTQKPIALYQWLLKNYAKPGDTILDTHIGSGSSAIACHDMGHKMTGYEIDHDYFGGVVKRLSLHQSQLVLAL